MGTEGKAASWKEGSLNWVEQLDSSFSSSSIIASILIGLCIIFWWFGTICSLLDA
jgi:hypothetical protein